MLDEKKCLLNLNITDSDEHFAVVKVLTNNYGIRETEFRVENDVENSYGDSSRCFDNTTVRLKILRHWFV